MPPPNKFIPITYGDLTPAQGYTGEILSYLLKVVLGRAGNPKSREDWGSRGLRERLDLSSIQEKLTDLDKNMSDVLVLDSNILDLNRVLYHYDPRLSLSKATHQFSSIYPAPELLGIRLFLLQKIHRKEKFNLKALIDAVNEFFMKRRQFSEIDLIAMNLRPEEMRLILDIIQREPQYFGYMQHPFLIRSLTQLGAVHVDSFVKEKIGAAHYREIPVTPYGASKMKKAVKILILPSLTREFTYGDDIATSAPRGFIASEFYSKMIVELKGLITESVEKQLGDIKIEGEKWDTLKRRFIAENLTFLTVDRPLVITPENASQCIGDVFPHADITFIILGKNIYLSLDLDEDKARYPAGNRIYLDIMDIKHGQIQEEVEMIGKFVISKILKSALESY